MKNLWILATILSFLSISSSSAMEIDRQSKEAEEVATPLFKNGIIATTFSKQAADNGLAALKSGGTAMDAALTVALTQVVWSAGSWVSYAGILHIVYYCSDTKETHCLDAGFNTVLEESDPLSIPKYDLFDDANMPNALSNGRTVLVPGFMAGLEAAHQKFGKLPFSALFQPAITLAKSGIIWTKELSSILETRKEVLWNDPEARSLFFNRDGSPLKVGDIFKQLAAAETLKRVAEEGATYMYHDEWAQKFVSAVNKRGGKMTLEDLSQYQPKWRKPLTLHYSGYRVDIHPLGKGLAKALSMIDRHREIKKKHYTKSLDAFLALENIIAETSDVGEENKPHSASIVVADCHGNVASLVHSINTINWGKLGLFVEGISIPDSASIQQDEIKKSGPGNRVNAPIEPGIVFSQDEPKMAFSAIGAGLHMKTVTTLLNILNFNYAADETARLPSFGYFDYINSDWKKLTITKGYSKNLLNALKSKGLEFKINEMMKGYMSTILKNQGLWTAGVEQEFSCVVGY